MISVAGTLVADLLVRPIRNREGKGHNANVDCIELLPADGGSGRVNCRDEFHTIRELMQFRRTEFRINAAVRGQSSC
jgi:hypothetical protein